MADLRPALTNIASGIMCRPDCELVLQGAIKGMRVGDVAFTYQVLSNDVGFLTKPQMKEQFYHWRITGMNVDKSNISTIQVKGVKYYCLVVNRRDSSGLPPCPLHFAKSRLVSGFEYWFKKRRLRDWCAFQLKPDTPYVAGEGGAW